MSGKTQYEAEVKLQNIIETNGKCILWLINDDFNTFDFVIDVLMTLCEHTYEQAFQCAIITHTAGKCDVYRAEWTKIKEIAMQMIERGLTVKITT